MSFWLEFEAYCVDLVSVRSQTKTGDSKDVTRVAFGDVELDLEAHRLYDQAGREISITSMEYDLLKAFADNPNKVMSRDQLLNLAHKRDWNPFDRSIDIRITRLRRKLEKDPSKPRVIKTVRGAGYVFTSN